MIAKSTINFTGYIRAGIILCLIFSLSITNIKSQTTQGTKMAVYQPPTSPRATYNFNSGWKFAFGDTTGADKMEFNDKTWANVSLPHTWNETDSYRAYISHGVRLPKSLFYVSRVMQNEQPDLHIIGHWNYPADTKKTMYVAATHCDKVEIFLNDKSLGVETKPTVFVDTFNQRPQGSESGESEGTGYVYAFPDIKFAPGTLKAIATKGGKVVAQQEIQTAGETKAIKLTLHTGPKGLQADGSDVALIEFEVVDAQGRRCPTDEARVDFTVTGPVIWRGGFNAAKLNTTNNLYLDTECGINRVAIRSTLTPGIITVTAKREGLTSAIVKVDSKPVEIINGLSKSLPQRLSVVQSSSK